MDGQSQELQAGAADQAAAGMPAPAAPVDAGMAGMAEPQVEAGVV